MSFLEDLLSQAHFIALTKNAFYEVSEVYWWHLALCYCRFVIAGGQYSSQLRVGYHLLKDLAELMYQRIIVRQTMT